MTRILSTSGWVSRQYWNQLGAALRRASAVKTLFTNEAYQDFAVEFVARTDSLYERLTCNATKIFAVPQYSLRSYTAF
jgi:hypothetical protein